MVTKGTSQLVTIAHVRNDSPEAITLFLEMTAAEVILGPGQSVELLASESEGLLPVTIDYVKGGLQVHPDKEFDPNWHVRFNGELIGILDVVDLSKRRVR